MARPLTKARYTRLGAELQRTLHLAAMEALGVTRLLTNDAAQAAVATALGFEVVTPG